MMRLMLGAAAALFLTASHAAADGIPSRGKTKAYEADRPCSLSGDAGIASEKVIRGFSESREDFSVQGGFELSCGRFYVGATGSSVNVLGASALLEITAGIRPKTGPITWDFGVIYHTYNADQDALDFYEFKAAAIAGIWKGGTIGAGVLYSPEYGGRAGLWMGQEEVWTVEGAFAQVLPNVGVFTPTFGASVGHVSGGNFIVEDYVYWNVGLSLAYDKWSLDLRYSDTDIGHGCVIGGTATCDERVTVSLKYSF